MLVPCTSFADVLRDLEGQGTHDIDHHNHQLELVSTNDSDLVFQVLDICYNEDSAALHISGCTKQGNPVVADINGFRPYFYIAAPLGLNEAELCSLADSIAESESVGDATSPLIHKVEPIKDMPGQASPMLKIYASSPGTLPELKNKIISLTHIISIRRDGRCPRFDPNGIEIHTSADCCLDLFMFELNLSCLSSWIRIPSRGYDKLEVVDPGPLRFAPLRMLSVDIEREVYGNTNSDPRRNRVFQISCMISTYGEPEPFYRVLFALDTCDPVEGLEVCSFRTETQMLAAWKAFFKKVDPDVLIGHNSSRFDWPYLIKRSEVLGLPPFEFARIPAHPVIQPTNHWPDWNWFSAPIPHGRVNLDTLQCLFMDSRRQHYGLQVVAQEFLGQKKEDVHFTEIAALQHGDSKTRRRLAIYCSKDTWLSFKLSHTLGFLEKLANISDRELVTLSSLYRYAEPGFAVDFANQRRKDFVAGRLRLEG